MFDLQTNPKNVQRYQFIQSADGEIYGEQGKSCPSSTQSVQSWNRWFVKCSYCFCLCDDEKKSDRYFSLKDAVSNIAENK